MPSYVCPYCGYPIQKDNVLFQFSQGHLPYTDKRRYAFYNLCSSSWPLTSDKFDGLYFFASDAEEGGLETDANGFPKTVRVRPCNGRTPTELEEMEIPGKKLDDYITQFNQKNASATKSETAQDVMEQASVFNAAAFGANAPQTPAAETEIKPADDGSSILLATRACPNCHNELHQRFGLIDLVDVTLLGGPAAGKTAYLISMVHQLDRQLSMHHLGTASLLKASKLYYDYLNASFQKLNSTMPTVRQEKLFPFVFYYHSASYTGRDGKPFSKECFVKFSDIAGESSREANELINHSGTMEASTLLLILDPNQLNNGLFYAQKNAREQSGADDMGGGEGAGYAACFQTAIPSFLSDAIGINVSLGAFRKITNIIVVITKLDMLLEARRTEFAAGRTDVDCVIRFDMDPKQHVGGLDLRVINKVEHELLSVIRNEGVTDLLETLRNFFPDRKVYIHLLGVSTYTLVDQTQIEFKNLCHEQASKHRIIEPFLCVLAANGMIPVY